MGVCGGGGVRLGPPGLHCRSWFAWQVRTANGGRETAEACTAAWHAGMLSRLPGRCPCAMATLVLLCRTGTAQVSEARLIELLEQVSEQTEKKTKVGCGACKLSSPTAQGKSSSLPLGVLPTAHAFTTPCVAKRRLVLPEVPCIWYRNSRPLPCWQQVTIQRRRGALDDDW